jgi:hypothetical protein
MPQARQFDYEAAFEKWYLGTRNNSALAREIGVTESAVRQVAAKERWLERAAKLDAEHRKETARRVHAAQQQHVDELIQLLPAVRVRLANELVSPSRPVSVADLLRAMREIDERLRMSAEPGSRSQDADEIMRQIGSIPAPIAEKILLAALARGELTQEMIVEAVEAERQDGLQ